MLLFLGGVAGACAPLADASREGVEPLRVSVEPDGALEAAPAVLRLRVRGGDGGMDPDDVYLVAGEVGTTHLGQLARGEPSGALSERLVPNLRWRDGASVVVAPTVRLEAGASYAVAVGALRESVSFSVMTDDRLPTLAHVWPPGGVGHGQTVSVWCGDALLPPLAIPVTLEPNTIDSWLVGGASEAGIGKTCVHLAVPPHATSVVPPPAVAAADGWPFARLEPVELRLDGEPPAIEPLACPLGQLPMGAACVSDVADDRLRVRAPRGDALWLFTDGWQLDFVHASREGSFLAHPLVPATPTDLTWAMMDVAGHVEGGVVRVFTRPPMAHLVITEVHANPVGPEPEQEFVELYNDGLAPAELGGFVLVDIGGETPLPPGLTLMPGAFALLVNEGFDVASDYDPPPAEGTAIVRVDKLGKGGLKNDGEPLKLIDASGTTVSRFPALPKPQSGISVQRVGVRISADEPENFVRGAPTPGSPYVPGQASQEAVP